MQRTNIYSYFSFGYNYCLLSTRPQGIPIHGEASLEFALDQFIGNLTNLELRVTAEAAPKLRAIREQVRQLPADATVDDRLADELTAALAKIDVTLDSELKLRSAFVATPGRFDLNVLLDKPMQLLDQSTADFLPNIGQFDFSAACQCLAFSMPTAAAFHLMRCVEGALRHYYCSVVKRDRVNPLLWGPMLDHLRQRRHSPSKAMLDHLDNIRFNFRNPTQHPDARYVLEEVQDLLSLAIDALNRIARDFKARKKQKSSAA